MFPLHVRNIIKRYGRLTALRHVSFAIWPGGILGLIGPNDSGKAWAQQFRSRIPTCFPPATRCFDSTSYFKDYEVTTK